MSLDLVTVVIVSGFVVVALIALFLMLALRYDQVVSAAGPLITRDELEAQIEVKRQALADIDNQLKDRTEAMENVAGLEAEVDALCRQRDEILAEHATLSDRKEEIREMDRETEEAVIRFAEAKRDLDEKEEALRTVQARLDRAEALVGEIESLQDEANLLRAKVDNLRAELGDLRQLKEDEANLRTNVKDLRREASRLEGATTAASERLHSVTSDLDAAEGKRAQVQASLAEALTRNEVAASEVRHLEADRSALEADRSTLEARIEYLRAEAGQLTGTGESLTEDPLRELKSVPPVLRQLKTLDLRDRETEEEALHRVQTHMQAHGLEYPLRTIRGFHTAMKVNETTQLAVLAGISGTGKSQLPRRYSEGMGIGFLQVPVQPRWDSPQDLMGFYNYIEGRFRPTDLARALYQVDAYNGEEKDPDLQNRMMMVLLDEMNLARVEYYFSDFLSRLESRPGRDQTDDEAARKDAEIELEIRMPAGERPPRIFPGYNVLFAGTMNEDESTQSLSDKVVDRANVLRFAAPRTIKAEAPVGAIPERKALSRDRWNAWVRETASLGADRARVSDHLETLVDVMRNLQRPIGHRLGGAMVSYVANYPETGGRASVGVPLADQVEMRLLPKLRGVEMDQAGSHLDTLANFVDSTLSDAELAAAIRESAELSREETGQFVWRGVTRR